MSKGTAEALRELVEWIKAHKLSVLSGMSNRETLDLMDALHKANVALSQESER